MILNFQHIDFMFDKFTLVRMLDDHTITTVCKVIGGLSADRLRTGLSSNSNGLCFVHKFVRADNPSLTFIEKTITDRQSSNTTDND